MHLGRSGAEIRRGSRAYCAIAGSAAAGAQIANEARSTVTGSAAARPVMLALSAVTGLVGGGFQPRALCNIVGSTAASAANSSQYSNGFAARRVFIYPGTFNGLIRIAETIPELRTEANGGLLQSSDGWDMRFTTTAGVTLPHILESYDAATGQIRAEVYGNFNNTTFYLYYGKSVVATEANPAGATVDSLAKWAPTDGTDYTGLGRGLTATGVTSGTLWSQAAGVYNGSTSELASTSAGYLAGQGSIHIHATVQGSGGVMLAGPGSAATISLRTATTGSRGGAANVWTFIVGTSGGFAVLESAANSAGSGVTVIDALWSSGSLPELYLNGVKTVPSWVGRIVGSTTTANAAVTGTLTDPGASGIKVGNGTTGRWTGSIGSVAIRPSTPTVAYITTQYGNLFDPQAIYGYGAQDTLGVTNRSPVAVPDAATTTQNTAVDVDVLANDVDLDDDTKTLSAVSDAENGTVAIATGRARFTPSSGFTGRGAFFYTVSDGSKTSRGKAIVTVGAASGGALTPAQISATWRANVPWLPTSDDDIVLVNVPASGISQGSANGVGQAGKVALLVPPSDGIITGVLNFRDTQWAGIILSGAILRPNASSTTVTPLGATVGVANLLWYSTTAASATGAGRPFFHVSNCEVDCLNTRVGDFLKCGSHGTNRANYADIQFQRIKFTRGHYGLSPTQFHSDIFQASLGNGTFNRFLVYDCDFIWRYQAFFHRPETGDDIIGTTTDIQNVVVRPMPFSSDFNTGTHVVNFNKICDFIDGGTTDYNAGAYMAWNFANCHAVRDPNARTTAGGIPADTGYFDSVGLSASVTNSVVSWSTPAKAPNPNLPATGTWTFHDSYATDMSGGAHGPAYRITTKANLRTATGL